MSDNIKFLETTYAVGNSGDYSILFVDRENGFKELACKMFSSTLAITLANFLIEEIRNKNIVNVCAMDKPYDSVEIRNERTNQIIYAIERIT